MIPFPIDVQFFARAEDEGRTEEPTTRRRSKAESEGNFPRSRDLPAPLAILAVATYLKYSIPFMIDAMRDFTAAFLSGAVLVTDPTVRDMIQIAQLSVLALIKITLPVMILGAAFHIAGDILQIGFHFDWGYLKFNWGALKPDFSRVFSRFLPQRETLVELVKSIGKILIVGAVGFYIFWDNYGLIVETVRMGLWDGLSRIGEVTYQIILWTTLLLIAFSIPDYFYQRYEYTDKLKMTKEEVKDEHKQSEGDPQVKATQRKRMMELISRRMLHKVPKADVVITNPTHYAVALRYDQQEDNAPICLAKGADFLALRIRDIAEKNDVPIYEDRFLARALYDAVEIGEEIPHPFYDAVANVLAFVYRLRTAAV
ncbi:MAG: flagellar biosynthesis protein FlhB [Candidatus Lindowbacteria bacterium RIFCSPLOWO2_12_FULL_62_27]|nr:MAG: flagellar biosynthesis protein FlhB [Candidatus Lindowbacteria bacterium RIFCSPLOWO2_12_FULL_62_27]